MIQARATGEGTQLELAQSDAAAAFDWYREETYRAYERPESEVTGNTSDDYVRREPAIAGMRGGVRYQVYASTDGYVLFMASEQHFWKKFCDAVGRPGAVRAVAGLASTATTRAATASCRPSSRRSSVPARPPSGCSSGSTSTCRSRRATRPRPWPTTRSSLDRFEWFPTEALGAEQLPFPVKVVGADPVVPGKAPELAEHTDAVLADVLGYDAERIAALRAAGAVR